MRSLLVWLVLPAVLWASLSRSEAGERAAEEAWPTPQVYGLILSAKDRSTFRLQIRRGGMEAATLCLSGDLAGEYDMTCSWGNLFPAKTPDQIGFYRFKVDEQQFKELLSVLRGSAFPMLKNPNKILPDSPTDSIKMEYAGKTRFISFRYGDPGRPEGFRSLWDGLVGVLSKCDFTAERGLRLTLALGPQAGAGGAIPIELRIRNMGHGSIMLPNPDPAKSKEPQCVSLCREKSGDTSKRDWQKLPIRWESTKPPPLALGPAEEVSARLDFSPTLEEPGEYRLRAHLIATALDVSGLPKKLWGLLASNECQLSLK